MSTTALRTTAPPATHLRGLRLLRALERPSDAFAHLGPNWFASVMGTGIVAVAATLLPHEVDGQHAFAVAVWALAATMLLVLCAATAAHWTLHRETARSHALNPAMAPFYGAPPMAFLTVGAGALLVGDELLGPDAALTVAFMLWGLGTIGGLVVAAAVPYLMFTRHDLELSDTLASWLMPVVPPMVSAATGAALLPHLPAGEARLTMLLACYAMFGFSLIASLLLVALLWSRLALHGPGPAATVPTLFIVLGPLGQSITAVNLLGAKAQDTVPAPLGEGLRSLELLYGIPVLGFALVWLAIAAAITLRTFRDDLPFSLTWWSFTFPVGATVTGISELARNLDSAALGWLAVALFLILLAAWATVLAKTLHGTVSGRLLLPSPTVRQGITPNSR